MDGGGVADVATIDIIVMPGSAPEIERKDDNRRRSPVDLEQYALERAQRLVKKANYRVASVIEHDRDVCEPAGH